MIVVLLLAAQLATSRWAGRRVVTARAFWAAQLPVACRRCGRPVTSGQRWHVGHILDRALGGNDDLTNTWPEHARCNTSAGGRLGAAITNGRRRARSAPAMPPERHRGIRGV